MAIEANNPYFGTVAPSIRPSSVDEYLETAEPARRAMLEQLRAACRLRLVGFAEVMRYGMPGYERDGAVEVGFASQRQYLSLYVTRTDVIDAFRPELRAALPSKGAIGKGCIRYRRPDQLDLELVGRMLDATAASRGPVC